MLSTRQEETRTSQFPGDWSNDRDQELGGCPPTVTSQKTITDTISVNFVPNPPKSVNYQQDSPSGTPQEQSLNLFNYQIETGLAMLLGQIA